MSTINRLWAYEILDARGNPTIATEIALSSGECAVASVPSGASTGTLEAFELRDGDLQRYAGKGVLKAIEHVNDPLRKALVGKKIGDQRALDQLMLTLDASPNKSNLGANAILSVSLAIAKVTALQQRQALYEYFAGLMGDNTNHKRVLPVPMINIINGGVHADNHLAIQEFMILPIGLPSFKEALRAGVEIFYALKAYLKTKNLNTNVGDEGGFAPDLSSPHAAIECILVAIRQAGYTAGKDIYLGLDVASTEFYHNHSYCVENQVLTSDAWLSYLESLVGQYPIITLEDGMAENDLVGWKQLTERLGKKIQLVGDDLFVTNPALLLQGVTSGLANAILIKPNQIGSLTEMLQAIRIAKEKQYAAIISHRSGETEDTSIADLAVGTAVGQIKTGSVCRTDRVAKYNRLLRIEAGSSAQKIEYAGRRAFSQFLSSDIV